MLTIGIILIALLFVGMFVLLGVTSNFGDTVKAFAIVIGLLIYIVLASYCITKGLQEKGFFNESERTSITK